MTSKFKWSKEFLPDAFNRYEDDEIIVYGIPCFIDGKDAYLGKVIYKHKKITKEMEVKTLNHLIKDIIYAQENKDGFKIGSKEIRKQWRKKC